MELESNIYNEYMKCVFFAKDVEDSYDLCLICMIDEHENNQHWQRYNSSDARVLAPPTRWRRYKLPCGHIFHTRCFRHWCSVKQCLNCSFCGNLSEDKNKIYCDVHDTFGSHKGCDIWKMNLLLADDL